jgi:acyl-coenzyme A thioesterase PaaI-like protein
MDVSAIPFNRYLGLQASRAALTLPADPNYLNHLGTVHASAQFALAEAASGKWLLDRFGEAAADYLAVVRHADVKFRRPAAGELLAKADAPTEEAESFLETLTRRGRAAIEVRVHCPRRGWERHTRIHF